MAASFPHAAPSSKTVFEKSSFLHEKSRHEKFILDHFFNHSITVVLPGCKNLPAEVSAYLEEEKSYKVQALHLHRLLDKEFIEGFLKAGHFYGLSSGTHIDTDDCIAVLPTGVLILNVSKDTYELLGLEGKPSIFSRRKTPMKYVVEIDLKSKSLVPGKKKHERLLRCLRDRLSKTFDLLVLWVPHEEAICGSSIQKYFAGKGYEVTEVQSKQRMQRLLDVTAPVVNSDCPQGSAESCSHEDVFEWLGGVACGIDLVSGRPDSYYSTYSCPAPSQACPRCCVFQSTGFLSSQTVTSILKTLRHAVKQQAGKTAWASLTVHGWADAPVSWARREHGFLHSGDNLYSFLIFPNEDYWTLTCFGTHDLCQ